jgi:uncharacterized protein (TIGR02284 family)
MDNKEMLSELNHLIEICRDGINGYRNAAEDVEHEMLKPLFREYAQQRQTFDTELSNIVRQHGGDPDDTSTARGTLHRVFMDLRSAISNGDEEAILSECLRGERAALDAYNDALKHTGWPVEIKTVIQRQYEGIQQAYERLQEMEQVANPE